MSLGKCYSYPIIPCLGSLVFLSLITSQAFANEILDSQPSLLVSNNLNGNQVSSANYWAVNKLATLVEMTGCLSLQRERVYTFKYDYVSTTFLEDFKTCRDRLNQINHISETDRQRGLNALQKLETEFMPEIQASIGLNPNPPTASSITLEKKEFCVGACRRQVPVIFINGISTVPIEPKINNSINFPPVRPIPAWVKSEIEVIRQLNTCGPIGVSFNGNNSYDVASMIHRCRNDIKNKELVISQEAQQILIELEKEFLN